MSLRGLPLLLFPICVLAQCVQPRDGMDASDSQGISPIPRSQGGPDTDSRFGFDLQDPRCTQQMANNWFNPPSAATESRKPVSGIVSLHQLQHPPSKKAARLFQDAQRASQAHEIEKAISKLEQAITIDPQFQEAHQNLGVQYARSGRTAEAVTQFQKALEIGPADAKAYSNLGWCYVRFGQFDEARNLARKALSLDPNNGPARTLLAVTATP